MGRILFLGTASGDNRSSRNKTAILVEDGAMVLFDAGEPCTSQMLDQGMDPDLLSAVFLSHAHPDHTAGLPALLQFQKIAKRTEPLPVFIPQALIAPLLSWLEALQLAPGQLRFPLEIQPISAGTRSSFGSLNIEAFATTHETREGWESFGFDVQTSKSRVVMGMDMGGVRDLETPLQKPTDFLVCELAHFPLEELQKFLQPVQLSALFVTHLAEELVPEEKTIRETLDEALEHVEMIFLPGDGEEFPV